MYMENEEYPGQGAFLRALGELSRKHGFVIGGCGDCGSPWVTPLDAGETGPEYRYSMRQGFLNWEREE